MNHESDFQPTRNTFLSRFRWWHKLLLLAIGFILVVIFFDVVAMPFYTRHGEEYELPDVTMKTVDEAMNILEKEGFIPIVQDSIYSEQYPPGTVVQQNPAPLRKVKKGRRVYMTISSGERKAVVPDVITSTLTDAVITLQEHGFFNYDTAYVFSDSIEYNDQRVPTPAGTVIDQSILPGEEVGVSHKIQLTVSMGPLPSKRVVPDLRGKSLTHAKKILAAIHLPIGKIRYQLQKNLLPNTVLRQNPPPNTPLLK
ncbi:MAG: PASTA domain-containing protein, partial [Calditrichaeota bacterium]